MADTVTVPTDSRIIVPGCAFLVAGFLPVAECDRLVTQLVSETYPRWVAQMSYSRGWPARIDKGHTMARFGDPGVTYTYKDKPKPMYPFTPALDAVRRRVAAALAWAPNCVVVNSYLPTSGLYPHRDGSYIPQLGDTPVIASVSFGATRTFLLHPADPATNKRTKGASPVAVSLSHGDLLVMHGECDRRFHHSIPEEPQAAGTRVSLTFRRHLAV